MADPAIDNTRFDDAVVVVGDGQADAQPEHFKLCPFGVQLYSAAAFEAYQPVALTLSLRRNGSEATTVTCTGIAIESVQEDDASRFCTFVKFLDLPEHIRDQVGCGGHADACLCNFCPGGLG